MTEKISRELQVILIRSKGPHKVSIYPKPSDKLEGLVSVNRYEGISSERMQFIEEETRKLLAPICHQLEQYGLSIDIGYVLQVDLRKVSALLDKSQIESLALQDYVGEICPNVQKGLQLRT